MKYLFLLFALAIISYTPISAQDAKEGGIAFTHGSWQETLALAAKEGKPVFIDCYAVWCGPCKWMDKNVFPDKAVADFFNENFIPYKLDMEKGEGPDLAKKYAVRNYPTFLFVDASGKQLHRHIGAMKVEDFLTVGETALDPQKRLSKYADQYNAGNKSPEFLIEYIHALEDVRDSKSAADVARSYFAELPKEELTQEGNWQMVRSFLNDINSEAFQYIVDNKAAFQKSYGEEVGDYIAGTALAKVAAAAKAKDKEAFEQILELLENNSNRAVQDMAEAKMNFYKGTGDWDKYAEWAITYFDNEYYKSSMTQEEIDAKTEELGRDYGQLLQQSYANTLNNHAWGFYERINDEALLQKAVEWVNLSIELNKQYYSMDTKAALLLKMGKMEEGKQAVKEAIEQAKEEGEDYKGTEALLEKYSVN